MSECQSKCACGEICRRVDEHLQHQCPKCNYEQHWTVENVAAAPATPAATPMASMVGDDGDAAIFRLACKLVDTASSDRETFWRPALSQLCEAVRKQDAANAAALQPAAATPLREANQQRVNAAVQRVRKVMDYLPGGDPLRKDVELLIEIALAPVLEIFAAAQPQRESEQLEQVAKLTDKILTELFTQYSGKEFKSFRHALRRTLEPIMRAAFAPQTDSQEPR